MMPLISWQQVQTFAPPSLALRQNQSLISSVGDQAAMLHEKHTNLS